jgi:dGTPase
VREGIIKHSRDYSAAEHPELAEYLLDQRPPLEAQLIDLVDEIAYNTADLDDGYEAHLIHLEQLCAEVPIFGAAYREIDKRYPDGKQKLKFNEALKQVLDRLATDLIENTRRQVEQAGVTSVDGVRHQAKRLVAFSADIAQQNGALKRFLFARLYSDPAIAEDRDRSVAALDSMFSFFLEHPERMPGQYAEQARHAPVHRVVCDYIAGMTDHFLLRQRRELLGASA